MKGKYHFSQFFEIFSTRLNFDILLLYETQYFSEKKNDMCGTHRLISNISLCNILIIVICSSRERQCAEIKTRLPRRNVIYITTRHWSPEDNSTVRPTVLFRRSDARTFRIGVLSTNRKRKFIEPRDSD